MSGWDENTLDGKHLLILKNVGGSSGTGSIVKKEEEKPIVPVNPPSKEDSEDIYFEDVAEEDWYYDAVEYVAKKGIMNGTRQKEFSPQMPLTREVLAVILYDMEGKPSVAGMENPFQDVKSGQWYTNAIVWAKEKGIIAGYSETVFGVGDEITREQLVTILYRYTKEKGIPTPVAHTALEKFTDKNNISAYAKEAM